MTHDHTSPLDAASNRLSAAFARLEEAITNRPETASAADHEAIQAEISQSWEEHCEGLESDIKTLQDEQAALLEENKRLSNQLQEAQKSYVKMKTRNHEAAKRLDQQIEQLELIVES